MKHLQPQIPYNKSVSIQGFFSGADAISGKVKVEYWLTGNHLVFTSSDHIFY